MWIPTVNLSLIVGVFLLLISLLLVSSRYQSLTALLFFIAGLLYTLLFCQYQLNQQIKTPTQENLLIKIDSLPKYTSRKVSFIAKSVEDNRKYLLSWYATAEQKPPKLTLNQIYQVTVNLKPPHGTANGVGFDREKWLFRHGVSGIGNIKNFKATDTTYHSIKSAINQWRSTLSDLINQNFMQPRSNALIHALSIGDKSHFDQRDMQTFQNTGTAHLIAISGLHIGMVAFLGWLIGGILYKLWPQESIPKPLLQILFGLVFAVFYACLAGLAVSTQRAVIMLLVLSCYKLLRRPNYAWDVWSTSLLTVLLIDPLNVLDSGFWLSFIAVAVLILAFNGQQQQGNRIFGFIKMQFTLLMGMLPLSLAVFSRVNLIAPVVNLLMIPVMTFLLIPVLLLLLLLGSLFNAFPQFLVDVLQWLSHAFIQTLDWFNQFSVLALNLTVTNWWQYVLLIIGAVILILPASVPQRYWGLLLMLLGLYSPVIETPQNHFKAHFLDVGQGLSVVIETQNHHLVYDVGAAYESGFNMADATLIPYLQKLQIRHIDALVLSHQDNDHAGAAKQFIQHIQIDSIWGTETKHKACLAGESWKWDGVKFTFLSPYNMLPYLKNNSSCVLKIESQHTRLLLTGDIEEPVEFRLQQLEPDLIKADVVLVPHHGSKTSSSLGFLSTIKPKLAINSSGQYNPFNHPAEAVSARYKSLNIPVLDTQNSGLITLTTYPNLSLTGYRQQHPRIWHNNQSN